MRLHFSIAIVCIFCLLGMAFSVSAFMGSSNYRIQQDSINIGGLDTGSSESYWIKDTMGEAATGESASETYKLRAGYREMDEVYVSLSVTSTSLPMTSLNLTTNVSANTATSGFVWTIKTDAPAGYILTLKTDRTNALYNTASTSVVFTDYTATSGNPLAWSVSDGYYFGFSVFGADVPAKWGTGSNCENPLGNTLKYSGFTSVTAITVASSNSRTSTVGTDTAFCVAAEQNNAYAPSGDYRANITATVIAQ